jgi:hypothetical protein
MKWQSWHIVAGLAIALVGVDLAASWCWNAMMYRDWQFVLAIAIGICVAQVNLIAIWAALAPGRVLLRLPWSICLAAVMWYAIVLGSRFHGLGGYRASYGRSIDMGDAIVLGLIILVGVVVLQIPLWAMSRWFAWRLLPPTGAEFSRDNEQQFNLKHMIVGTLLASLLLGLGRVILPTDDWSMPRLDRELTAIIPAILIVNLLVVVPCIWVAFLRKRIFAARLVAWLVAATIVSILEVAILSAILGPPPSDVWATFVLFNVTQGLAVIGVLLVLRAAGFRLERWQAREKSPASPVTEGPPSDIMPGEQLITTKPELNAEQPS